MRFAPKLLLATVLGFCLVSTSSLAETLLFEATYQGKFAGLTIDTRRSLVRLSDGSFELTSKASNFMGSVSETSHFTKHNEQWRPLKYTYQRRILGAKTREEIAFDWQGLTAYYTHSSKPERDTEHRLTPGVLDPALYQLRLQRDLILGLKEFNYRFVKRDRIHHYVIQPTRTEDLSVLNKDYRSIKVQRANADDDKQTFVWLIPELNYLLGKIVHLEDDGDTHQMVLTKYNVNRDPFTHFFVENQVAHKSSAEKLAE